MARPSGLAQSALGAEPVRPQQMQEVWIPLERSDLAADWHAHVRAVAADGREANHIFCQEYCNFRQEYRNFYQE